MQMGSEKVLPAGAQGPPAGFFGLVAEDMAAVETVLAQALHDDNPLVQSVADYLLEAPGKRIRPALVLLSGKFGPRSDNLPAVAAAVEMIHMATLVHDDIIDRADRRRGQPALRVRFSDQVAVLAGDFLFARAFQIFAQAPDPAVVRVAAEVVRTMCAGEIAQNLDQGRVASEDAYLARIAAKTADFVEASCRIGALAAGCDSRTVDLLGHYGFNVGMAFQLIDDLLDWEADPTRTGKAVGEDIAQGTYTLPVIHALGQSEVRDTLTRYLSGGADLALVRELLRHSGSLGYAREVARRYRDRAMRHARELPAHPVREALLDLAAFVVQRDF